MLDRPTGTVYAHPVHQLRTATTYRLQVHAGHGLPAGSTTFTGREGLRRGVRQGQAQVDAPQFD